MRKIILVSHISIDGFIAREDGSLNGFEIGNDNLAFVNELTKTADAALFGRISYNLLNAYWPAAKDRDGATAEEIDYSNWYNKSQKIVISTSLQAAQTETLFVIDKAITETIKQLKNKPGGDILLFGSASIAGLLEANHLIDSYYIFINPVLFGKGISLFRDAQQFKKLRLQYTKQFGNGELALYFSH